MRSIRNLSATLGIALVVATGRPASADAPAPSPPASPAPSGDTLDFDYDGKDIGRPDRAWLGRAYLPHKSRGANKPLPLVVFLHGLNKELIPYRWMGGGKEGDVRKIVGDLVESGALPPVIVAAPSSVIASAVSKGASWGGFDLDHFVERTKARLAGHAAVDEDKIIVVGHSGAGCSDAGGLATAGDSGRDLLAIISVDTCMGGGLAARLGGAKPETHVVVTYQAITWQRPFGLFRAVFDRARDASPPRAGVFRVVEQLSPKASPHDATLPLTLERWLPKILAAPPAAPGPPKTTVAP